MKHTTPDALLSRELLSFIRDRNPTVEEFVVRFGSPGGQEVHVLRKHGVVVVEDGRVRLSDRHLSPDGQRFFWRNKVIYLDRDEVWTVCYGPKGPPVSGQDA